MRPRAFVDGHLVDRRQGQLATLCYEHGMHEVAQVIVAPRTKEVQNTMTESRMCDSDPVVSVFTCEEERTIDKGWLREKFMTHYRRTAMSQTPEQKPLSCC